MRCPAAVSFLAGQSVQSAAKPLLEAPKGTSHPLRIPLLNSRIYHYKQRLQLLIKVKNYLSNHPLRTPSNGSPSR